MTHQLHHKGGGKEGSLPSDVTVSQESDWGLGAARSNIIGRNKDESRRVRLLLLQSESRPGVAKSFL